jgi:hypothetical protein
LWRAGDLQRSSEQRGSAGAAGRAAALRARTHLQAARGAQARHEGAVAADAQQRGSAPERLVLLLRRKRRRRPRLRRRAAAAAPRRAGCVAQRVQRVVQRPSEAHQQSVRQRSVRHACKRGAVARRFRRRQHAHKHGAVVAAPDGVRLGRRVHHTRGADGAGVRVRARHRSAARGFCVVAGTHSLASVFNGHVLVQRQFERRCGSHSPPLFSRTLCLGVPESRQMRCALL